MSAEVKIERKNDFSLTTDAQIKEVIMNVLYQLSKNEDHTVSKDLLKFDQNILKQTVNKLNIEKSKTVFFERYTDSIYIKVGDIVSNTSSTTVHIDLVVDNRTVHISILIPPKFSESPILEPVSYCISKATRDLIPEIDISFVEVTRESTHGVKEYYYLISLKRASLTITGEQSIEVINNMGNTDIFDNVLFGENQSTVTTNIIKTSTILTPPVIGFDDIVDRDKIVRSSTINAYEVISKTDYQSLEANGNIDSRTVYSIPEDFQLPNPDAEKVLYIKVSGTGTVDIFKAIESCTKIIFNGEVVETIPANTTGLIEIIDAVAHSVYDDSKGFRFIEGLTDFYGDIDAVNMVDASKMFSSLNECKLLDVSSVKSSVLVTADNMFNELEVLEFIDLSAIDISNIETFNNVLAPQHNNNSLLNTISLTNMYTPITDTNVFNNFFGPMPSLNEVFMSKCDSNTINMLCSSLNNVRVTTADTKIKVHVDSASLVEGLTFSNIEFIY